MELDGNYMRDPQTIHCDDGVITTGLNEHNVRRQMPFLSHPNGRSRKVWLQKSDWGGDEE